MPLRDNVTTWYWPRPIRSAPDEVKLLWAELVPLVTHPIARARVHDLCFSAGVGNGRSHAVAAGRAYLGWVNTDLDTLHVTEGLVRAWTLSRQVGDAQLEAETYDALLSFAEAQLAERGNPGTIIPLLEALSTSPRFAPPLTGDPSVAFLVEAARRLFRPSYLQVRLTAMMRRLASDDAAIELANRAEIEAHLDEADRATVAAVRMHHLELAAQTARRFGIRDLESQAVSQLQSISPKELGLLQIQARSSLPAYLCEAFLRDFDEAHNWREAIDHFLHTDSPTGDHARNVRAAQRQLEKPSLRHLFPTKRLGGHGMPQQTVAGEDDRLEEELVSFEIIHSGTYGLWYSDALSRVAVTFGVPPLEEMVTFFIDAYSCDARIARAFAQALHLFWEGRVTAAAHLAVPKIETAARALLLELDEPIYRVELGKSIGQFPGLGFLLAQLVRNGFHDDWERFLGTMLLPRGENLRNLLAHGFVDELAPYRAALTLRALGLMMLLSPPDAEVRDADVVRNHLRDPLALANRNGSRRVPIGLALRRAFFKGAARLFP